MAERKRGYTFRDFTATREADLLGPYPPWDGWKHALYERLKDKDLTLPENSEGVLHEWYVLRREVQLGKKGPDDITSFHNTLDEESAQLFENAAVIAAFKFITEKTEVAKERNVKSI